jgi:hypothetical protein
LMLLPQDSQAQGFGGSSLQSLGMPQMQNAQQSMPSGTFGTQQVLFRSSSVASAGSRGGRGGYAGDVRFSPSMPAPPPPPSTGATAVFAQGGNPYAMQQAGATQRAGTMPSRNPQSQLFGTKSMRSKRTKRGDHNLFGGAKDDSNDEDAASPAIDWKKATQIEKLHALIALQNFDGSWPIDQISEINDILGQDVGANPQGGDAALWVTVVIVLYIERKMGDEEETWGLVVEKARGWMHSEGSMSLDVLEVDAEKFIDSL